MMKTLCVAIVVLSLTSVCQPASLACQKLLKPQDKGPDLSGRWYYIAMSSEVCLAPTLLNTLLWPSMAVDITSEDTPNVYSANVKAKLYGYCLNETETFFYENNTIFNVDSNNAPTGTPDVLLQSGCPDCIIVKGEEVINSIMLFSRRKTVTAAELQEFETQTKCLGWSKPQVFNADQDHENCRSLDEDISDDDAMELFQSMYERGKKMRQDIIRCLTDFFLSYLPTLFSEK